MTEQNDKKNSFNIFEEYARGAMYQGGQEREDFIEGYVLGLFYYFVICVILYTISVITSALGFDPAALTDWMFDWMI